MSNQPLADRMRPRNLNEIIGQQHLFGPGKFLTRMVDSGIPTSIILYGPPGVGKTSVAKAMAGTFDIPFFYISAVKDGKKDIEKAVAKATPEEPVMIFVDEVHRFSSVQQETLLPYSESGAAIVVMASTENPMHQIGPGLRSRARILELKKLFPEDIKSGITRALLDAERGLGSFGAEIDFDALDYLSRTANGDMRIAFNALELAVTSTPPDGTGKIQIRLEDIQECITGASHHDKKGDQYYDLLAALQKSVQGSAVDAALHYAARLLDAGEIDILMRRLVVTAHEDMGLSAPHLGPRAITTWQGIDMIGAPEGRILIGKLVVEMCLAPKSNSSYKAMNAALSDVKNGWIGEIPKILRDASYETAEFLGNGKDYKYPHDYPYAGFGGWVHQQYKPGIIANKEYYKPIDAGEESRMKQIFTALKNWEKAPPQ